MSLHLQWQKMSCKSQTLQATFKILHERLQVVVRKTNVDVIWPFVSYDIIPHKSTKYRTMTLVYGHPCHQHHVIFPAVCSIWLVSACKNLYFFGILRLFLSVWAIV